MAHFQRRIALNYDCNSPLLIFAFWFRDTFWGFSSCDCRQNLIITLVSSEKNAFFGSNFRLQSQKWKRLQQICLNAVYSILNSKVQNAADFCVKTYNQVFDHAWRFPHANIGSRLVSLKGKQQVVRSLMLSRIIWPLVFMSAY